MKERLVEIGSTGTITGLHFEDFSLTQFGKAEIYRATDIRWNAETQKWDISLLDKDGAVIPHHPEHLLGFKNYEAAREHEVRYLQTCRLEGFGIMSARGDALGRMLRVWHDE